MLLFHIYAPSKGPLSLTILFSTAFPTQYKAGSRLTVLDVKWTGLVKIDHFPFKFKGL